MKKNNLPSFDETEEVSSTSLPSFEETEEIVAKPTKQYSVEDTAKAYGIQGASLGSSDEIDAATKALSKDSPLPDFLKDWKGLNAIAGGAKKLYDVATTDKTLEDLGAEVRDDYVKYRDKERSDLQAMEEQNPKTAMAANVLGNIATTGGIGLVGGAGAKYATGFIPGAIQSAGESTADNMLDVAKDTLEGGNRAGALNVVIPGAGNAIKNGFSKVVGKVDESLPTIGKIFSGVDQEATEKYLAKKGNLPARSTKEIADELTGAYNSSVNDVSNLSEELSSKRYNNSTELPLARDAQSFAQKKFTEELGSTSAQSLRSGITKGISDLKGQVSKSSAMGRQILDNTPGQMDISSLKKGLSSDLKSFFVKNKLIGNAAKNDFKELNSLVEDLSGLKKVSYPQARQILDRIRENAQYGQVNGEFSDKLNAILTKRAKELDGMLKSQVPAYQKHMASLSEDTGLLSNLSDNFGDDSQIISKLSSLDKEKGIQLYVPMLKQLAQKTGQNYDDVLNEFILNKGIKASPTKLQKLIDELPESQALRRLEQESQQLKDPNGILGQLKSRKEDQTLFNRLKPENVEKTIETGSKPYFDQVGQKLGKDISTEVENRNVLNAFDNPAPRSIARTTSMTGTGAVIGGTLAGPVGAGIGATTGFLMDNNSQQLFKKVLNIRIKSAEHGQKIAQKLGKYGIVLNNAAQKGGNSLGVTSYILQNQDPEYREVLRKIQEEDLDE